MRDEAHILVVDDDPKARQLLTVVLGRSGYVIKTAATSQEALERARERDFDAALLDIVLPDGLGVDLLLPLRDLQPDMAVVMITGHSSTETAVQALNQGARAYITKPLRADEVRSTVGELLDEKRRRREEREMVEALRQYAAELETRNEDLDAFAQTVAHDLKGPAYKISGYAETLLQQDLTPLSEDVQQDCLRIMAQGARQVSSLVDELLLLARVQSEEVETWPLPMGTLVARARRRLNFLIEDHQAELTFPEAWPTALGHGPWVEQVWVNYISNAVKYGGKPEQDVPPRVELGHGPDGSGWLSDRPSRGASGSESRDAIRFWVRDNGRGLAPEEQERLFQPFTRLDQVDTQGTGLGLSVVRRIVEKLGGDVGVESRVGEGSIFSFSLPRYDDESS